MIRNLLEKGLGALVLGLGLAHEVQATELAKDTGSPYTDLTHPRVHRNILEKSKPVNYDTWQKEIVNYDGATLVLFNSSCNQTSEADILERNMEIVYLRLIDKFEIVKVNGLPLKFGVYDQCGKSKSDLLGIMGGLQTNMYLNGKLIDALKGGPINEIGIKEWYDFLSQEWVPTNLTAPNGAFAWKFEGSHDERKVPYKP